MHGSDLSLRFDTARCHLRVFAVAKGPEGHLGGTCTRYSKLSTRVLVCAHTSVRLNNRAVRPARRSGLGVNVCVKACFPKET